MRNRVFKDGWLLCFLALAVSTLFFVVVAVHQNTKLMRQVKSMSVQMDVLSGQNHWSIEDRAELHENQERIREALKHLETKK